MLKMRRKRVITIVVVRHKKDVYVVPRDFFKLPVFRRLDVNCPRSQCKVLAARVAHNLVDHAEIPKVSFGVLEDFFNDVIFDEKTRPVDVRVVIVDTKPGARLKLGIADLLENHKHLQLVIGDKIFNVRFSNPITSAA